MSPIELDQIVSLIRRHEAASPDLCAALREIIFYDYRQAPGGPLPEPVEPLYVAAGRVIDDFGNDAPGVDMAAATAAIDAFGTAAAGTVAESEAYRLRTTLVFFDTPLCGPVGQEGFVVVAKRMNGGDPLLAKVADGTIHMTREDAAEALVKMGDVAASFEVREATVYIRSQEDKS